MSSHKDRIGLPIGRVWIVWGVLLIFCFLSALKAWAFVQNTTPTGIGVLWPNAQATLNLQLGCPATPLANWGPCWDNAAEDAATRWNDAAAKFRFFKRNPPVAADPCIASDGVNAVAFSSTICGMAFGTATLAVTLRKFEDDGTLIDVVVLFDASRNWSTYPGPLQPGVRDLHRVAIHEFGHVLGLGHPDEHGQNVVAIMNSTVSNIDSLQSDDIAGVNAIYPPEVSLTGFLENPQPNSFQSGIGIVSGWKCTGNNLTFTIDNSPPAQLAYGTSRLDTQGVCGDSNNGFAFLINWNLAGNGTHTIRVFDNGVQFASATFTVTTLGTEFLSGASGRYGLPNFPQPRKTVTIRWQESQQNFVIDGVQ